jgi:hypothetical protein
MNLRAFHLSATSRPRRIALSAVCLTAIVVLALQSAASATVPIDLLVRTDGGGGMIQYRAWAMPWVFPGNPDLPFITGEIANADNQFRVATDWQGWLFEEAESFSSLDDLIVALQKPWQLTLDKGLPTERAYQMSVNLGALADFNSLPPTIQYPLNNSTVDSLHPTMQFTLPPSFGFTGQLVGPTDAGTNLYTGLSQGQTTWTPAATLVDGGQYLFDIYSFSNPVAGMGFSVPTDAEGNPVPNFTSRGTFELEAVTFFTVKVPEPSSWILALPALLWLVHWQRNRTRRSAN